MRDFGRLRARLTAVCAISTGIVLVAMAAVSYHFSVRQMKEQYRESMVSGFTSVCSYLREQPVITHTWLIGAEWDNNLWLHIRSDTAQLIYDTPNALREWLMEQAQAEARAKHGFAPSLGRFATDPSAPVFFEMMAGATAYRVATGVVWVGDRPLVVTALRSQAAEREQIVRLGLYFSASVVAAMVCLLGFAWLFSKWVTRPVEESRKRQIAFVGAASHEFRTPVAVIQMGAENIKKAPPELVNRFADTILRECGRLGRLTEDMLQLAGADSQNLTVRLAPVNPESVALSVHEACSPLAGAKGIALALDLPPTPLPKVRCDRERVEQVLDILLDNALQYTPEGGRIALAAYHTRQGVCFSVEDSGPGIPDDQKSLVFERFYRQDRSRSRKEHYGLGLSIALEIALLHKGSLTVEDGALGGCKFVLTLPFLPTAR